MILFLFIIGLFFGSLYSIVSFSKPEKPSDLKSDPRITNLLWVLGGALLTLLGDWGKVSSSAQDLSQRIPLLVSYGVGVLIGAFLTIIFVCARIYCNIKRMREENPSFLKDYNDFILDYLYYGYNSYKELIEVVNKRNIDCRSKDHTAEISEIISISYSSARFAVSNKDQNTIIKTTSDLLKSIENIIKLLCIDSSGLALKSNLMIVSSSCSNNNKLKFSTDPDLKIGKDVLLLKRHSSGGGQQICLPMPDSNFPECALPGAPEATLMDTKQPAIINCQNVKFRTGIPSATQKEIKKFFSSVSYKSVISLPLLAMHSGQPQIVGVVNIESNRENVLGEGVDKIVDISTVLSPMCLILATLADAEKNGEETSK